MIQLLETVGSESFVVHGDALLEDVILEFLESVREDVNTTVTTWEQRDYETIRVWGHNMKGYGGSLGFDIISDIGRSLEYSAKMQNSDQIRRLVEYLSNYLEYVEVVYD